MAKGAVKGTTSIPPSLSPSVEAVEGAVADRHPQYFVGRNDINFDLIEALRADMAKRGPVVVLFEQNITAVQQHVRGILHRFAPTLEIPMDASLGEIYYASLIHAFTLKTSSALEDSIFNHLPGNTGYKDLRELAQAGQVWPLRKSLLGMWNDSRLECARGFLRDEDRPSSTEFFEEQSWEHHYSSYFGEVRGDVKSLLPAPIYHPTTPGELGLALLIKAGIRDVYPIGLSQTEARVHGTALTPGSLARHDKFHGEAAQHSRHFTQWVMTTLGSAHAQNLSVKDFLREAGPHFQKQYQMVMGMYDYLYQQTTALLIQGDEKAYKTMLVAFFLAGHEYPDLSESTYSTHHPVSVLQHHLKSVRAAVKATLGEDKVPTDYRTGETSLSDEEIVRLFFEDIVQKVKEVTYYPSIFDEHDRSTQSSRFSRPKAVKYLNENVKEVKVKRTPYATDVQVELNDGKKFVVGSTTNKVRLMLNDDYRKLLAFLGQKIPLPRLGQDPQENTASVKAYYAQVQQGLLDAINFFEERAIALMDPGILMTTASTPSFASRYFRESWDNHEAISHTLLQLGLEKWGVTGFKKPTTEEKEAGLFLHAAEKRTALNRAKEAGPARKFFE